MVYASGIFVDTVHLLLLNDPIYYDMFVLKCIPFRLRAESCHQMNRRLPDKKYCWWNTIVLVSSAKKESAKRAYTKLN